MNTTQSRALQLPLLFAITILYLAAGCKKENTSLQKITATPVQSSVYSDGIVTVQASILPPVTPQTFVANGSGSLAQFQVTSSQHVFLYSLGFTASYPLIQGITAESGYANNNSGFCSFSSYGRYVPAGQGITIQTNAIYNLVDNTTSGSVVSLNFANLEYRTDDEQYHNLYMGSSIAAQNMCLVNNLPHIKFRNPVYNTLTNGFTEIAEVRLTGDTGWTLNKLPLYFTSFSAEVKSCKLIVQNRGSNLSIITDSVKIDYGGTASATIKFRGGFHHTAGVADVLKIYGLFTNGFGNNILTTRMYPLSSFEWTDNLGVFIPGAKNAKFYKDDPGQSETDF